MNQKLFSDVRPGALQCTIVTSGISKPAPENHIHLSTRHLGHLDFE